MIRLRRCNHLHVIAQASIHAPHGRDILVIAVSRSITVSIHAPTRVATRCSALRHLDTCVSIHAPTRGATAQGAVALFAGEFQSTRPHGARRLLPFSIVFISMRFNPRAHTGRDTTVPEGCTITVEFQSTRPHEARRIATIGSSLSSLFQSTRPHGARQPDDTNVCSYTQFQSTRPHGARRKDTRVAASFE